MVKPYVDYFDTLSANLKKSDMKLVIEQYLSLMLFGSLISLMAVIIVGSMFITIVIPEVTYSYTLAIIAGLVTAVVVFVFGYYYPSLKASGKKNKIDKSLRAVGLNPDQVNHMVIRITSEQTESIVAFTSKT